MSTLPPMVSQEGDPSSLLLYPRATRKDAITQSLEVAIISILTRYPFRPAESNMQWTWKDTVKFQCAIPSCRPEHQRTLANATFPVRPIFGSTNTEDTCSWLRDRHVTLCTQHRSSNRITEAWPIQRIALALHQILCIHEEHGPILYTIILAYGGLSALLNMWWRKDGKRSLAPVRDDTNKLADADLEHIMTCMGEDKSIEDCRSLLAWMRGKLETGEMQDLPTITLIPQIGTRDEVITALTAKQRQVLAKIAGCTANQNGWNWQGRYPAEAIDVTPYTHVSKLKKEFKSGAFNIQRVLAPKESQAQPSL